MAHPIGESQLTHVGPLSPMARSRKDPPRTAAAMALAERALAVTCAATAATAAKTRPHSAIATASATDPAAGSPVPARNSTVSTAMDTFATAAVSRAAVSGAYRPTTVAPRSSSRPVSSSVRVCRTTVNRLISATRMNSVTPIFQAVSAPMLAAKRGPLRATNDAFVSTVLTTRSDSSSG
jgi:hypothetical protein